VQEDDEETEDLPRQCGFGGRVPACDVGAVGRGFAIIGVSFGGRRWVGGGGLWEDVGLDGALGGLAEGEEEEHFGCAYCPSHSKGLEGEKALREE